MPDDDRPVPIDDVDVLIPTCGRPVALAVTLAGLVGQTVRPARVVVSDQTEGLDVADVGEVQAVARVLGSQGIDVRIVKHLPRRGLAEQRNFLLEQSASPLVLFLDDDVVVEGDLVERLVRALRRAGCGFVGSFVNAPSAIRSAKPVDTPPGDLTLDLWEDDVVLPERVRPGTPEWQRSRIHFAAYLHLVGEGLGITKEHERLYKVAWVGGCVLFDADKLRAVGGFDFWPDLPPTHVGEDVLAQIRVMERFGGAGLAPSGAWHMEVPTTTRDRRVDAPLVLLDPERADAPAR